MSRGVGALRPPLISLAEPDPATGLPSAAAPLPCRAASRLALGSRAMPRQAVPRLATPRPTDIVTPSRAVPWVAVHRPAKPCHAVTSRVPGSHAEPRRSSPRLTLPWLAMGSYFLDFA